MSMAALEAENARLQAENDRLRCTLGDIMGEILCGRLTGKLPDNFLEQFTQLPDRPLEQVLRFLPPGQVAEMRYVSRKFNHLIRKSSKTMPKKKRDGTVVFESNDARELTVEWINDSGKKIVETKLAGDEVAALSELLRFIRIGGRMYFGGGLSATDKVLDQLSKAWLTICPDTVIFSCDLSQTSRDSLKAFLVKVEPSIRRLHFQNVCNSADSLLSDDVIGAAGRLDYLMVMPLRWSSKQHNINIGDETVLAMADVDRMPSYFCFMGCSGITPGGIRAFVEKWMKNERLMSDGKTCDFGKGCELAFYNCTSVTPAAVEEACADLLKDTAIVGADASSVGYCNEIDNRVCNGFQYLQFYHGFQYPSSNRHLKILFSAAPFFSHLVIDPRMGNDYQDDLNPELEYSDFDDNDDDEDSDLN
uniref:F-box domain-containing protein n=1 Tax=Plectus sambesii TaxID=2011161 RepID=A0A914XK22_9BILA